MKIIKRNGSEEVFDVAKIASAITKANAATDSAPLSKEQITEIADYVEYKCNKKSCRIGGRDTGYGRESDYVDRGI